MKGRWHQVPDAGLNPLPVQRPIPIWMGGESERVVRRATRVADGWMPHFRPQVPRDQWTKELAAWRAMRGVTHVSVNTMNVGLKTPADHVETLRRFKEEAGVI